MAIYGQAPGRSNEWYTPSYVFEALGCRFDLDVAAPEDRRFCHVPAGGFYSEGGLEKPWRGFVWMNPPFGGRNGLAPWLAKFENHKNGVALVPDRTSAPWWQAHVPKTDLILFSAKKVKFIAADGSFGDSPADGVTLLAYGAKGVEALYRAEDAGFGVCFKKA